MLASPPPLPQTQPPSVGVKSPDGATDDIDNDVSVAESELVRTYEKPLPFRAPTLPGTLNKLAFAL